MTDYDVAFVGTGANPENPSGEGFAMAYSHADAYEKLEGCSLVACADIVRDNAEAFAETYDVPAENVFEDYEEMLRAMEPDVVSVCTPPAVHAELVVGCARSGGVDAIHCEKPMARTWGGAQRMAQECWRRDVQLTINHQRRFGKPFRNAKELLDGGEIGDLKRVEYTWGNFYDNGTHAIDLCTYFNDERPAEWVIGGLDYREEKVLFGAHNENQMFALWEYDNGVHGIASTGEGSGLANAGFRLVGTDGEIEIDSDEGPVLRVRRAGDAEWEPIDCDGETIHGPGFIDRAIADVIASLREGRECELGARNALTTAEIIFGGYESVRRRGRVDFPLEIEDNPLESMIETGALTPVPRED